MISAHNLAARNLAGVRARPRGGRGHIFPVLLCCSAFCLQGGWSMVYVDSLESWSDVRRPTTQETRQNVEGQGHLLRSGVGPGQVPRGSAALLTRYSIVSSNSTYGCTYSLLQNAKSLRF